jgi:hypothetical protein
MLDDIKKIKSTKKDLRDFGLAVGAVLLVLGGLFLWLQKGSYPYLLSAGLLLILAGLACPRVLLPLQKAWMTLAVIIGWLMTRVILLLLFYLALTPTNLIARLFGKQFLDLERDPSRKSYWNDREAKERPPADYEKQF